MNNIKKKPAPNKHLRWKTAEKTAVCKTPVFTVNRQAAVSPDGAKKNFITVDAADWVIVVPVLDEQEALHFAGIKKSCFLLVEQWRHGAQSLSVEFPSGVIDKGESPEHAAHRELAEETGFSAQKLSFLGCMNPNPALFCNMVYFFAAENLTDTLSKNPDEDEFLQSHIIPADEAEKKAGRPPYIHALMATALCLYKRYKMYKVQQP